VTMARLLGGPWASSAAALARAAAAPPKARRRAAPRGRLGVGRRGSVGDGGGRSPGDPAIGEGQRRGADRGEVAGSPLELLQALPLPAGGIRSRSDLGRLDGRNVSTKKPRASLAVGARRRSGRGPGDRRPVGRGVAWARIRSCPVRICGSPIHRRRRAD
jgi:hypothetical protein